MKVPPIAFICIGLLIVAFVIYGATSYQSSPEQIKIIQLEKKIDSLESKIDNLTKSYRVLETKLAVTPRK